MANNSMWSLYFENGCPEVQDIISAIKEKHPEFITITRANSFHTINRTTGKFEKVTQQDLIIMQDGTIGILLVNTGNNSFKVSPHFGNANIFKVMFGMYSKDINLFRDKALKFISEKFKGKVYHTHRGEVKL